MHCPYCGVVLEEAHQVWWVFYRAEQCGSLDRCIVTCEAEGQRRTVELGPRGVRGLTRPRRQSGRVAAPPKPLVSVVVQPESDWNHNER